MNCFNLCQDAKTAFRIRLCYLAFLIFSASYCVILLSMNLFTWFTIVIISANVFSIIITFIHLWYLIHTNRTGKITVEELYICTWELLPTFFIFLSIIGYIINIYNHSYIEAEFALMISYALIIGCGIVMPLICTGIGLISCCLLSTYDNIKNREPQYDSTV